ncbi:MAG: hypothetical protein ACPGYX_00885 [Oceanobacter sp.]
MKPEDNSNAVNTSDAESTAARREFMKKLGKFAALTPPTVAMLMTQNRAHGASGGNNGGSETGSGSSTFCAKNPDHSSCL